MEFYICHRHLVISDEVLAASIDPQCHDCLMRTVAEGHYSNLCLKRSSLRYIGLLEVMRSRFENFRCRNIFLHFLSKRERKSWSRCESQLFSTQCLLMVANCSATIFADVLSSRKHLLDTGLEVVRFCWRGHPQRSLKRGFKGTGVSLQHVDGFCCRSTISEQLSKRTKTLGHDPEPGGAAVVRFPKNELGSPCLIVETCQKEIDWDSLPNDIHENIIRRLEFRDTFRFKTLSKSCKKYIESDDFRELRGAFSEGSFTAINYYIKNKVWQCSGFDLHSKSWRALPPFSYLPPPDAELFKEYSVHGHGGLMCAEVSKLPKKGELVVFNSLTREKRALPPLLYPRIPVLVHISVDSAQKSYKVIVAGSSTASDEHLSRKMEIFDSSTFKWKETSDVPGPAFGLNEHQPGVCLNGKLFFISFLEGDCRRGVVAFDVEEEKWLENLVCPIPFSSYSNTLQLVESDGKVYLFSEQERGPSVEHCIDELEFRSSETGAMACQWRTVVRVRKSGGRGLLVYPEHTCVGFGEGKLLIFNTLKRDGVVYDMRDGQQCEVLEPPPGDQIGDKFFTLNPASFTFQPSFDSDPISEHH